jgi:hypothetical protein
MNGGGILCMSSVAYSSQLELRPCNLLATRQGRGGAGSAAMWPGGARADQQPGAESWA